MRESERVVMYLRVYVYVCICMCIVSERVESARVWRVRKRRWRREQ